MNINRKRHTTLTAVFVAAALALTACGDGDDGTTDVTVDATVLPPTTAGAATETTVPETTAPETTVAPTTTPDTTSGPDMTTGPVQVVPEGWEVHDPGTGYTIALPPHWVDVIGVVKGDMKPEEVPGLDDTSFSPEVLQDQFGASLELVSLLAVDTRNGTADFTPTINVVTTPLAEDLPPDQAKGELESQLSSVGDVTNSEVTSVGGLDAIRTQFTTEAEGNEITGVQLAVLQPNTLTLITYTGLEVPNNLDKIFNTFTVAN